MPNDALVLCYQAISDRRSTGMSAGTTQLEGHARSPRVGIGHRDDAGTVCDALRRLDHEPALAPRLVTAGLLTARAHTLESESAAAATFLAGPRGGREAP